MRRKQPQPEDFKSELDELFRSDIITPPEELLRPILTPTPVSPIGLSPVTSDVTGTPDRTATSHMPVLSDGTVPSRDTVPRHVSVPRNDSVSADNTVTPHVTVTSDGTRSKAKPVVLAQDGQSRIETAIYDYLWAQGREVDTDTREIRIGYRELANSIHPRIHRNSSRNNLESLRKKLAIDIVGREDANGTGRTYRVYGYKTILKRRREAGLIWYTEGREGSRLLSVSDVTVTSEGTVLSSETVPSSIPATSHGPATITSHVLQPVTSGVPQYRESRQNKESTTTAIQAIAPEFDDAAVTRFCSGCRAKIPDITEQEIVRVFAAKWQGTRGAANRVGALLATAPGACVGIVRSLRGRESAASQVDFRLSDEERQQALADAPESVRKAIQRAQSADP